MDKILADLLQTFRSVARRRLSTLTIVGVFGLGCGASTAIFALADPFLLRPLPYADPDALMVAEFGRETSAEAAPTLRALQNRGEVFDGVGAFRLGEVLRVRTHTGTRRVARRARQSGLLRRPPHRIDSFAILGNGARRRTDRADRLRISEARRCRKGSCAGRCRLKDPIARADLAISPAKSGVRVRKPESGVYERSSSVCACSSASKPPTRNMASIRYPGDRQ
jgi:hypothetical protein